MIVKCNFSQIYSLVQIEANILSIFDNCIDYYKFLMVNLYIYIYIYIERERERERERESYTWYNFKQCYTTQYFLIGCKF